MERVNCNNVRARKNTLENFSSNGKTISRRRNYSEPGFCGSDFGFFQSVRCPIDWTKVTEARGARLWSWYVCFSDEIGTRCFAWLRRLWPRKHPDALDLWQEPMMLRGLLPRALVPEIRLSSSSMTGISIIPFALGLRRNNLCTDPNSLQ